MKDPTPAPPPTNHFLKKKLEFTNDAYQSYLCFFVAVAFNYISVLQKLLKSGLSSLPNGSWGGGGGGVEDAKNAKKYQKYIPAYSGHFKSFFNSHILLCEYLRVFSLQKVTIKINDN